MNNLERLDNTPNSGPEFNNAQSSQLFINCCFAISFGGEIWLVNKVIDTGLYYIFWLPLSVYLLYVVWRQYCVYYIPLQYYRNKPESEPEEIITLLITLLLGTFAFFCVYLPHFSWLCIVAIIVLNLIKVKQMKKNLSDAPNVPSQALNQLHILSLRLWVYLGVLAALYIPVLVYDKKAPLSWRYHLCMGGTPIVVYVFAKKIFDNLYQPYPSPLLPEDYIKSIAAAWKSPSQ